MCCWHEGKAKKICALEAVDLNGVFAQMRGENLIFVKFSCVAFRIFQKNVLPHRRWIYGPLHEIRYGSSVRQFHALFV